MIVGILGGIIIGFVSTHWAITIALSPVVGAIAYLKSRLQIADTMVEAEHKMASIVDSQKNDEGKVPADVYLGKESPEEFAAKWANERGGEIRGDTDFKKAVLISGFIMPTIVALITAFITGLIKN